jgi:Flp pilus assembly protein protease CpaA
VTFLLCLISLAIINGDLRTHIISNRSLFFLTIPLTSLFESVPLRSALVASLFLSLLAVVTKIGGGDVKLLLLLIWTSSPQLFSFEYWRLFLAVALVLLLIFGLRSDRQEPDIPMAPAILLPLVAIHLGI